MGGNRIEIILPQASNEEVEEIKKMLTDQGSLEFRILANHKHDSRRHSASARAGRSGEASSSVQVGASWRSLDRHQPPIRPRIRSPTSSRNGRKTCTPGSDVDLTGKDSDRD